MIVDADAIPTAEIEEFYTAGSEYWTQKYKDFPLWFAMEKHLDMSITEFHQDRPNGGNIIVFTYDRIPAAAIFLLTVTTFKYKDYFYNLHAIGADKDSDGDVSNTIILKNARLD